MKILFAGSQGLIGSYLYSFFNKKFFDTIAIDIDPGKEDNNCIQLNLANNKQVVEYVKTCDQINILVFLIGLAHAKGKGKDLPEFRKVNCQTLINLLTALAGNNKVPDKIIFASTISVYGEKYHQSIYDEDLEPKPLSPYAVTKLEAEQYLLDNFRSKSWILRFAPVYSSDFLLNISRRTKMGGRFYRVGKGLNKLSLCNIRTIGITANAIINDKVPKGIYNISDPIEYTYDMLLNWQKAKWVLYIPVFAMKILYHFGRLFNSTFLKENTVKLISDNIFPSEKIRSYVNIPAIINDLQLNQEGNS